MEPAKLCAEAIEGLATMRNRGDGLGRRIFFDRRSAATEERARREVRAVGRAIQRGSDGWGAVAWPEAEPVVDAAAAEMSWHTVEQSQGPGGRSAAAEERARLKVSCAVAGPECSGPFRRGGHGLGRVGRRHAGYGGRQLERVSWSLQLGSIGLVGRCQPVRRGGGTGARRG